MESDLNINDPRFFRHSLVGFYYMCFGIRYAFSGGAMYCFYGFSAHMRILHKVLSKATM